MKFGELRDKFELYIMSLWFLFFLIIVVTVDIPICFGDECQFIGISSIFIKNIVPFISFLFLILGVIFHFRFGYRVSGSKALPVELTKVEDQNYEHLTFLTTYIIPLICFNLTSTRYVISLFLLLIIIGIIYVKTDKFYANPTLAVLGFRLYKVSIISRIGTKDNIIVISKDRLSQSDQLKMLNLDEKVFFGRKVQ